MEPLLAEFGVTQTQFTVLTMIAAYPGCSSADIARLSLLTPQTVTVIVANLKRDGLLETTPHPIHGRIRQLDLTVRGETVLEQCKAVVGELEEKLASNLSKEEESVIRHWLVETAINTDAGDEQ